MKKEKKDLRHFNQILPGLVEEKFPEIIQLPMYVATFEDEHALTGYYLDEPNTVIQVNVMLRDAPLRAKRGALGKELVDIWRYYTNCWNQVIDEFSGCFSKRRTIKNVQKKDDILIAKGMGEDLIEYNWFLTHECGYRWKPTDGYNQRELRYRVGGRHSGVWLIQTRV